MLDVTLPNRQHKITPNILNDNVWECTCGAFGFPNISESRNAHLEECRDRGESMTKKLIYLCSPHSHTSSAVRLDRYKAVLDCNKWLIENGFWIFAPIVSSHFLTELLQWTDFSYWKEFDTEMITKCEELWVLMMPGTGESKGVRAEIEIARLQEKKIRAIWWHEYTKTYVIQDFEDSFMTWK